MENFFALHKGARVSLRVVGVLLILLFITAPFGIWILWRIAKGGTTITDRGITARALTTVQFDFAEVARLGVCKIPIHARGIGGALARYKVGGDHGINICVILKDGKKRQITISMYENYERAMDLISTSTGKLYEELPIGMLGIKWPESASAA